MPLVERLDLLPNGLMGLPKKARLKRRWLKWLTVGSADMATQNKAPKRPQVVGPFQGVNPPEDLIAAPTPPPPPPKPVNELKPSEEMLRKAEEEERLRELRDESGKAAEASRRASMGTLKEKPVKKANGGYVKAADGCAQRGKTKGRFI